MNKQYSIELDCPPGNPRPGDLLPYVIKDTGLILDPKKPNSTLFGNWEWLVPQTQNELYEKVQPIIKERVSKLYDAGQIRYGSW